MNYRAIIYYVGMVLKLETAFLLAPLFVSLAYSEQETVKGVLITMAITLFIGMTIDAVKRGERTIYVKDGFVLVAICWICVSVFGAMPFFFSGAVPSFVDCLFESISGFTTTGSSILTNVEVLPKGLLLWRSLTHWIGGMGVLVFLLAVVSNSGGDSVHVMKAESPGPAPGKLVPRLRQSSKILYSIYFVLTLLQVGFLLAGGMPLFDSVCNALATAGTGGFSITNASIAAYDSTYIHVVITVFMLLFGVNFNMYYFLLIRNWKGVWRSTELRVYLGIFAVSTLLITWNLIGPYTLDFGRALRDSAFQVSSVMTTTGFATADFSLWPQFSRMVLLGIMIIGASAGSTSGGLKVSRLIILVKEVKRLLTRMGHPRSVEIIKLDGKAVDKVVVHGVNAYAITLMLLAGLSMLIVALDNFDFETTVTSVITCISNVGPGYGKVSAVGNFSEFSVLSKLTLSLNMLIGRLEIYPILLLFAPRTWRRAG